jgi:catechol 2,3-dioxygenase
VISVQVKQLGHAVLKVRDIQKAEDFYNGVLGLPVAARMQEGATMTFFTLGNHHDFAVVEVDPNGPDAPENGPGLFHVAFKVGESLDELREVKQELEAAGVPIEMIADHTVTQSIYCRDPDGNGIELYIDCSDVWRTDPQTVAAIAPMTL